MKIGAEYSHFYQHKKSAERGSSSITRGSDNETMTLDGENKYGSRMGCCWYIYLYYWIYCYKIILYVYIY